MMINKLDDIDKSIIRALAKNNMRVFPTAKAAYVSPGAVNYRIRRIRKRTGLNPKDFFDLYRLWQMVEGRV